MKKNRGIIYFIITLLITRIIGEYIGFHYSIAKDGILSFKLIIDMALFVVVYVAVVFIIEKLQYLLKKEK